MSILIKDMEMPKELESFTVTIKYNGLVFDAETGIQVAEAQEVPPHGRLIDADALKDLYHYNTHDSDIDKAWTGNIRRSIDSAHTVIEAEEVYGQYTDTAGNYHWCGTHSGEHTVKAEED